MHFDANLYQSNSKHVTLCVFSPNIVVTINNTVLSARASVNIKFKHLRSAENDEIDVCSNLYAPGGQYVWVSISMWVLTDCANCENHTNKKQEGLSVDARRCILPQCIETGTSSPPDRHPTVTDRHDRNKIPFYNLRMWSVTKRAAILGVL